MNGAAIGSVIVLAKLIFLPHQKQSEKKVAPGLWLAIPVLGGGLLAGNFFYGDAYSVANIVKALAFVAGGWLIHGGVIRKLSLLLPRTFELFEQLIGVMTLMLVGLFWMVLA